MPDEISFGPFRLDRIAGRLWRDGAPIEIQPRPLAVLAYLALRPGVLVTRADLLTAVWGDVHVSRSAVKVAVHAAREALGEARLIETVGRRGYRFVGGDPAAVDAVPRARFRLASDHAVGRARELERLGEALAAARAGRRQMVFVTGEAGIGKTTLVDRFVADARERAGARIARGQCVEQYAAGEAYLPVHDALGQLCGGGERAEVVTILRRYAPAWLAQHPALLAEAEWIALQRTLEGLTHERLLREIAEAIEAVALGRPLVLVLEDLHWSDTSTVELLARLARRREDAQLVVVGTYRPTDLIVHEHSLRDVTRELVAKGLCTDIALELLSAREVVEYVGRCLHDEAEAVALGREVHRRTEGNPLFMANVVQDLWDEGVVGGTDGEGRLLRPVAAVGETLPTGVRALIEKQLARLGAAQRQVLEVAGVVGVEFAAAAVAAGVRGSPDAVDEILEELAAVGHFVEDAGLAEWPDGTVSGRYRFRHALYVEVLAGRIAGARRVRVHRTVAEREERGFGERMETRAAELAVHFEAGRVFDKAARYHELAGMAAAQQSAHREARWHFAQALASLAQQPPSAARCERELALSMKLGMSLTATCGYTAPEVEQAFARALELSAAVAESPRILPAVRGLREFYAVRGELRRAREFGERMLRIAARQPDAALLGEAHFSIGSPCFYLGELATARVQYERSLAAYSPSGSIAAEVMYGHDPAATTLSELAVTLWLLGRPEQAQARSAEAIALVEAHSHPFGLAHALTFDALVQQLVGEVATAAARAETVAAIAAEHGFPHWRVMAELLRGWALVAGGAPAAGTARLRGGIATYEAVGVDLGLSYWRATLAEAHGAVGEIEEGLAVVAEALARIERTDERVHESELHRVRGELVLARPAGRTGATTRARRAEAEGCFARALEITRARGARGHELRAAMSMARLWRARRRGAEARALVGDLVARFDEGLATRDLREARRWLDAEG